MPLQSHKIGCVYKPVFANSVTIIPCPSQQSDSIDSDDDSVLVDQETSCELDCTRNVITNCCVRLLVTLSGSYSKKHKNQPPGSEGRRKEPASKLLDGIEFSKQYNNGSEVSPLHSYQMRVNSKKGYVELIYCFLPVVLFSLCRLPQVVGQKVRLLPVTNK